MDEPPFVGDWVRKMKLGCGAFGVVTLWQNDKTGDSLAIKMCRRDISHKISPKQRERWTKEVQIMKNINHPNIVHTKRIPQILFEALKGHNGDLILPILSMEFCSKGSLRQVLNQSENCSGLLESEVRFILNDISSAVAYLHNMKITHRDLKPDNIVLQVLDPMLCDQIQFANRPNKIIYKLIDLGYAKELDEKSISESFVGTLQYLAPEILLNKSYSNSVDYWSFGLLAFEIICGVRPFLPNMAPAQWLLQIQVKESNIIRIYQDMDEAKSILRSDKIYAENYVSNALQTKLECWLRLALEYDTKQRGYERTKQDSINNVTIMEKKTVTFNDIEIQKANTRDLNFFTFLDNILATKIMTVFVIYTYQFLSYDVEEGMRIIDLLEKIQKDTNNEVLVDEMILISPNQSNQTIKKDDYVEQLWTDNFDTEMLHIWKQGSIISDQHINLNSTPELIKKMCFYPKIKIPGHILKKFAADCLFYIKREIHAYDTLILSCNNKIKRIQNEILNMTDTFYNMKTEWTLLSRNIKTAEESLQYDCEKSKFISQTKDVYNSKWIRALKNISAKISTIHDAIEHIAKRHDSIKRRNNDIDFQRMFRRARIIPDVEALFCDVKQHYEYVRRILKGDFSLSDNPDICKNLKKLIVTFISVREKKMLKDPDMKKNIQYVIDMETEILKIISTMNSAIDNISKLHKELKLVNFERQGDIWALVSPESKPSVVHEIKYDKTCDERKPEFAIYATPKQTISNKVAPCVEENLLQNLTNSISGNFDYKSMIDDNMSLRYMHQDLIQECLDMYKTIMNDHMDFDFLKIDD